MPHALDFLFQPQSVAVVGASSTVAPGSGGGYLASLLQAGFRGDVYPVNPRHAEVQGLRCYASVRDIPGPVDHVISCIPAAAVAGLIEDCGAKGVRTLHLFTAGFSETGVPALADLETRLVERAKALGVRVIGPNCMGLYVPAVGLSFMPTFPKEPGKVAFISQSGAVASGFVSSLAALGLRCSKVISYGNGADLREADLFDYIAEDPETEVVAAYLEGVRDGRPFVEALKKASARKRVAIVKGGRTESGGRATRSHTASLAGSPRLFDALCRQAGAVRVDDMEELLDIVVVFSSVRTMPGRRAAVIIGGGGRSVMAADEAEGEGLELPLLPADVQDRLHEFVPEVGTSMRNPIDCAINTTAEQYLGILQVVAGASEIDLVLFAGGGARPGASATPADVVVAARRQVTDLAGVQAREGKPVVLIAAPPASAGGFAYYQSMREAAAAAGVAVLPSVRRASLALSRLYRRQRALEE